VIRVIAGFILAPATFPLLLIAIALVKYASGMPGYRLDLADAVWVYAFALPAALILGLPAHLVARRRGVITLSRYVIGGLVIGAIVASSFFIFFPLGFRVVMVFAWSAGIGAVSGGVFWLIVVHRMARPPSTTQ